MNTIRISGIDKETAIAKAVREIRAGGIVAFPTETFYGLGADFSNMAALKRLFQLKGRPTDKPVPLIIGDIRALSLVARVPDESVLKIIERFWPGPLTALFVARPSLPDLLTGGTGKVAVRVPGRSFALDLVREIGFPITSTSANISGMPPAKCPDEVVRYFGDAVDMLVDGGRTPGERPSTIIDMSRGSIKLIRQGAVPYGDILKAAGISKGDTSIKERQRP